MATQVWEGKEIEEKAVSLIKSFEDHSHLVDLLDGRIKFYFVEKGSFDGKARMIRGATADAASGTVFLIEINFAIWSDLNERERWALVDTQLSKCGGESNDADGSFKYCIEKPNIDAFTSVVKRWGAYNDSISEFVMEVGKCDESETMKILKSHPASVTAAVKNVITEMLDNDEE